MSYVGPIELAEAVAEVLSARWPERVVYRDVCPAEFERPSFFLYVAAAEPTDANADLIRWTAELRLIIYDQKDDHYETSSERLLAVQAEVFRLLSVPIPVGDRRIKVNAKGDGRDPGEAYASLAATWLDARNGVLEAEQATQPMESIYVTFRAAETIK